MNFKYTFFGFLTLCACLSNAAGTRARGGSPREITKDVISVRSVEHHTETEPLKVDPSVMLNGDRLPLEKAVMDSIFQGVPIEDRGELFLFGDGKGVYKAFGEDKSGAMAEMPMTLFNAKRASLLVGDIPNSDKALVIAINRLSGIGVKATMIQSLISAGAPAGGIHDIMLTLNGGVILGDEGTVVAIMAKSSQETANEFLRRIGSAIDHPSIELEGVPFPSTRSNMNDMKAGDIRIVKDASELPELPQGLRWQYSHTEEPPFTGQVYKVVGSSAQPKAREYKPGDRISVKNVSELPALPQGLTWKYEFVGEPPFVSENYIVVQGNQ